MRLEVQEVARHRNGIGGEPFDVVRFTDHTEGREMVAVMFGGPGGENELGWEPECRVAVLDIDETAHGNIAFAGGNSWRGDQYAEALRPLVDSWYAERYGAVS